MRRLGILINRPQRFVNILFQASSWLNSISMANIRSRLDSASSAAHFINSLLDTANVANRRPRTSSIRPQRRPLRTFWYKTVHRLFAWIHIY